MRHLTASRIELLQARLNAARAMAREAYKAVPLDPHEPAPLAPYLYQCAVELERSAGALRAAADRLAQPSGRTDCSS